MVCAFSFVQNPLRSSRSDSRCSCTIVGFGTGRIPINLHYTQRTLPFSSIFLLVTKLSPLNNRARPTPKQLVLCFSAFIKIFYEIQAAEKPLDSETLRRLGKLLKGFRWLLRVRRIPLPSTKNDLLGTQHCTAVDEDLKDFLRRCQNLFNEQCVEGEERHILRRRILALFVTLRRVEMYV